nr:hypothetical protein [Tanacetum cinerariifolium]
SAPNRCSVVWARLGVVHPVYLRNRLERLDHAPSIISWSDPSTIAFNNSSLVSKAAIEEEGTTLEGNTKDLETGVTIDSFTKGGEIRVSLKAGTLAGRAISQD